MVSEAGIGGKFAGRFAQMPAGTNDGGKGAAGMVRRGKATTAAAGFSVEVAVVAVVVEPEDGPGAGGGGAASGPAGREPAEVVAAATVAAATAAAISERCRSSRLWRRRLFLEIYTSLDS